MEIVIDKILKIVKNKMMEQGAFSRDAYKQFIDETIVSLGGEGELSEEESEQFIKSRLMMMWDDVKETIIFNKS